MSVQDTPKVSSLIMLMAGQDKSGGVATFVDQYAPIHLNGETFQKTVRTSGCEMLVHGEKCKMCSTYCRTLHVLQHQWSKRSSDELSSSSNNQYLNTPEKLAKVANLRQQVRNAENEVIRLKESLCNTIEKSEPVDQGLHNDLSAIMDENTSAIQSAFREGSFHRVFWNQQLENSKKTDPRQYRWRPLMAPTHEFETNFKCCLPCHAVQWFCDSAVRKDTQRLHQLHRECTWLPTGGGGHDEERVQM